MKPALSLFFAVLTISTDLTAQSFSLEKSGGAIGDQAILSLHNQPNRPYILIVDLDETDTDLGDGL